MKKRGEKMKAYTFKAEPSLLERLKEKAGLIPVSVIIRRLIEKYLKDEIDID